MGTKVACFPGAVDCSNGSAVLGQPASVCSGLGHDTCRGGTFPLNSFGQALENAGFEWTQELCQADSDGDGQTNGQELGDPCCQWTYGAPESAYMQGFSPSHPGHDGSSQGADYAPPACGRPDTAPGGEVAQMAAFAPGEEQRHVDFHIKDYAIPSVRTDYVDFVFNFHDDDHEIYHIVFGEAIVDQPLHLHHYVVTGCSEHIEDELEGVPLRGSDVPSYCRVPVGGFAGWAPGAVLWDNPIDAGIPIGAGANIVGFMINVHFTDGDLFPGAVSRDGLRVYYTPDLRGITTDITNPIFIGQNRQMVIPSGVERWFITRTCEVTGECADLEDDKAIVQLAGYTCAQAEFVCHVAPYAEYVQTVCPATCGVVCSAFAHEDALPLASINFHGHLLATEMYQSLTRDGATIDVGSASPWHYDDQVTFPLLSRNLSLKVGDVLQSTCVYNSKSRSQSTIMGPETVDEMCIISIATLRHTHLDKPLVAFHCKGDAWTGELAHGEDALHIAESHPLSQARAIWQPRRRGFVEHAQQLPTQLCPARSEAMPTKCLEDGEFDEDCCALEQSASCAAGLELELVRGEACHHTPWWTAYSYMCCTPVEPSPAPTAAPTAAPSPVPPTPTSVPTLSAQEAQLTAQQEQRPAVQQASTVSVRFRVTNIRYEDLAADESATAAFTGTVRTHVAAAAGADVTPGDVDVELAAGSVAVTANVRAPSGPDGTDKASEVMNSVTASASQMTTSILQDLQQHASVVALSSGGLTISEPAVQVAGAQVAGQPTSAPDNTKHDEHTEDISASPRGAVAIATAALALAHAAWVA